MFYFSKKCLQRVKWLSSLFYISYATFYNSFEWFTFYHLIHYEGLILTWSFLPQSRSKRQVIPFWGQEAQMLPSIASSLTLLTYSKSEPGQQLDMGPTVASLSLKQVQTVCITSMYCNWGQGRCSKGVQYFTFTLPTF